LLPIIVGHAAVLVFANMAKTSTGVFSVVAHRSASTKKENQGAQSVAGVKDAAMEE